MSNTNTLIGISTAIEWEGKTIIVTADDLETLTRYLAVQKHLGSPEARRTAIMLGDIVELPPIPAYMSFAKRLNGRQIGNEITQEEEAEAAKERLVIVFGYSDDCMELRGAIHDEVGMDVLITNKGKVLDHQAAEALHSLQEDGHAMDVQVYEVMAKFADNGWIFHTEIPHAKFQVMEDDGVYGEGLVFSLKDL